MKNQNPLLTDWCLIAPNHSIYDAPETAVLHLHGKVYGHNPEFPDGTEITTSAIRQILPMPPTLITQSGSRYTLALPEEKYREQYPDFWEKLLAAYG